MLVKRTLIIAFTIVILIALTNIVRLNAWIARHSVPAATYVTLYPFPFLIESSYTTGRVQGIELGEPASAALLRLARRKHCQILVGGELVKIEELQISDRRLLEEGRELVMRCKAGGVAWNEILVIKGGAVEEVRISGGLWT